MKLSPKVILQLSLMICGDDIYKGVFPTRTLKDIIQFFYSIDYRVEKPNSNNLISRQEFALTNLEAVNFDFYDPSGKLVQHPTPYIENAIKELLDPSHFTYTLAYGKDVTLDYQNAINIMNNILRNDQLSVFIDESNKIALKHQSGEYISTAVNPVTERVITFCPEVFKVPNCKVNTNLVAVMMHFSDEFNNVYKTIENSCDSVDMKCIRSDNNSVWDNSEIIQDIFKIIFSSAIVITDFSPNNKSVNNKNVYYEAGIAHTLGKFVIPLAHSKTDLPFDLDHYRAIFYTNDAEGLVKLNSELESRLKNLKNKIAK